MVRIWRQYAVLGLIFLCALTYEWGLLSDLVQRIRHGAEMPSDPFSMQAATRTIGSGPLFGNQILALNGHAFTAKRQLDEAVARAHPGDKLHLLLRKASGAPFGTDVRISSELDSDYPSLANIALDLCLFVLIPTVCLGLGFGVAFIRPRDPNAWILLALLIGFSVLASSPDWHRSFPTLTFFWEGFGNSTYAVCMMLFAIYFPTRFALDRRAPWAKYLILVPAIVVELIFWSVIWIWYGNIDAALAWRPLLTRLYFVRLVTEMAAVGIFFAVLGTKSGKEKLPDDRRRLRILWSGASLALSPTFLVVIYSLITGHDMFVGVPWPIELTALSMLALFPLTLAYVIVVDRAMDLRFAVRQSVKYGLARGGLWLVRAGCIGLAVYVFSSGAGKSARPLLLITAVAGLVVTRRQNIERASATLDRRFFREAYDAEKVLGELAGQVSRYLEIDPLLRTVAQCVSETLHVPDIVFLLLEGNSYKLRYSTRPEGAFEIAAGGGIAAALREQNEPIGVFFDRPPVWMQSLDADEMQTLNAMGSQLLMALPGKDRLAGIMSLGHKLSDAPYSKTDTRLLQSIALQMGMALENSRLSASLAHEAAQREAISRELEIAREVQERLFPQKFPKVAGVDCFGYCRPARGVGGDYYDFVEQLDGKLGIAIGDVSGKGIAAALLMASLQASLRGQAMAGIHDLAELMRNVNKLVYDASQSNRYATFFYGEFDPATRQFAYVNAGHNAPLILRGGEIIRLEACGPVVGLLPGVGYTMDVCGFLPGDTFVGYTDGISEAMNEQDEEWEEERFIAAARSHAPLGAKGMIEGIFLDADVFTGSAKQYDDMTLLVMKLEA